MILVVHKEVTMLHDKKTAAIIAAAGSSTRMGGVDKCFLDLDGQPVLAHTMGKFQKNPLIDAIVVVTRSESIPAVKALVQAIGAHKVTAVVSGGSSRQQSVLCGVQAVSEDTAYICIHDGGRPLVSEELITRALAACAIHGAVTAAVPVKDTIKVVEGGLVTDTPPREKLYSIQTPQVFDRGLYLRACKQARAEYTDDCQLIEAMGERVYIVEGEYTNIKLTTPEDIGMAAALIKREEHP